MTDIMLRMQMIFHIMISIGIIVIVIIQITTKRMQVLSKTGQAVRYSCDSGASVSV